MFLISIVYTLGMYVITPFMVYGLILKGICPILITKLNESQITNTIYKKIQNSKDLKHLPLKEAVVELELQQLEGWYLEL